LFWLFFDSFFLAFDHPLVNNCLECGKIVCAVEGAGPCFFCGNEVLPRGHVDNSFSSVQGGSRAIQHKDRLLDFDRNASARSVIFGKERRDG